MNLQNGEPKALVVRPKYPLLEMGDKFADFSVKTGKTLKEVVTDQQTQKGENEFASFCRNKNAG